MSEENKNLEPNNENNDNTEQDVDLNIQDDAEQIGEAASEEESSDPSVEDLYVIEQTPKKQRKISLKTFVLSLVAITLVTVMLTYTLCFGMLQKKYAEQFGGGVNNGQSDSNTNNPSSFSETDIINALLDLYFYGDVDIDKLTAESLRAYLAATGDIYSAYYTQEELDAVNDEGAGRMCGVGVNIINSKVVINDTEIKVLKVINVMKDSPAQEKGMRAGDMIAYVGIGEDRQTVNYLGYDEALKHLKGEENTVAEFTILRKNGDAYDEIEMSVTRRIVTTESVYARASTLDSKIGIIKITGFELKTPIQFSQAVEDLKKQGCEKFIMDLRNNPGGYLLSIAAILSYFLDEGDVYIYTEDKTGKMTSESVKVVSNLEGDYATCNVSREDIGKFKGLDMVVLCNENTASAAELFTATFKDYGIAKVVGTTTFGKGKMQNTFPLSSFGLDGAVKFTTHMYYSKSKVGYDGIGIKPDVEIPLNEAAKNYNVFDIPDDKDNQLLEAIKHFN